MKQVKEYWFQVFMAGYLGWLCYSTWRDDGWMGVLYFALFGLGVGLVLFLVLYIAIDWYVGRGIRRGKSES